MSFATPLTQVLWPAAEAEGRVRVYALLDGARDARLYPNLLLSGTRYACLYRGAISPILAPAAPYLAELRPDLPFVNWLLGTGWGQSWGVFLASPARLSDLLDHFRQILIVKDPQNRSLYFRYYDPRVLRAYLPTCIPPELDQVFGPVGRDVVDRYVVEQEAADRLTVFSRRGTLLRQETVTLSRNVGA